MLVLFEVVHGGCVDSSALQAEVSREGSLVFGSVLLQSGLVDKGVWNRLDDTGSILPAIHKRSLLIAVLGVSRLHSSDRVLGVTFCLRCGRPGAEREGASLSLLVEKLSPLS